MDAKTQNQYTGEYSCVFVDKALLARFFRVAIFLIDTPFDLTRLNSK